MAGSWYPGETEFGQINKGYFVNKPDSTPDQNGEGKSAANAFLESGSDRVYMWVNDVSADFSLGGETAQSKGRRSFFPRNFVQPSLTIAGQTPNSFQYQRLGEFVRHHHKEMLRTGEDMRLAITAGGIEGNPGNPEHPRIKGRRSKIVVRGHVESAQRGAERWVNAPDFSFNFVVTQVISLLGLEQDQVTRVTYENFIKLITSQEGPGFEEGGKPDLDDGGRLNEPAPREPDPEPYTVTDPTPFGGLHTN